MTVGSGLLQDKVALVTGAGDGIGRGIALRYAAEGATVVVTDIDDERGRETLALIERGGGRGSFHHLDVRESAGHAQVLQALVRRHGRLDVACNNAGISGAMVPAVQMSDAQWLEVIGINLTGVFYGMREQVRTMLAGGRGGAIVNLSSILGQVGFETTVAYTAAKHGVVGMTKTMALEYGEQGIRINAVGPTFINTSWIHNIPEQARGALAARHPLRRFGEVAEVAAMVAWLSSAEASYVTGAYFPVDGGYLAG